MNYLGSVRNSKQQLILKRIIISWVIMLIVGCIIGFLIYSAMKPKEVQKMAETATVTLPTQPPVSKPTAEKPKTELVSLGIFELTAYCPCEKCCGKWGKNRPTDEDGELLVYTASGQLAKEGVTIAADSNILPFGTNVIIDGHSYIVQDKGGRIKGNRIDIYFENHQEALEFGIQEKEIFIERMIENDEM